MSKIVKSPHSRSDPRLSDLVLKDTRSQRYVRRDESGRFVDDQVRVGRYARPDGAPSAKPNSGDRDDEGDRGK